MDAFELAPFDGTATRGANVDVATFAQHQTEVLVETDAPYLTPHPYRGKANSSYLLPWTVRTLADLAALDVASVCAATRAATRRAFALA